MVGKRHPRVNPMIMGCGRMSIPVADLYTSLPPRVGWESQNLLLRCSETGGLKCIERRPFKPSRYQADWRLLFHCLGGGHQKSWLASGRSNSWTDRASVFFVPPARLAMLYWRHTKSPRDSIRLESRSWEAFILRWKDSFWKSCWSAKFLRWYAFLVPSRACGFLLPGRRRYMRGGSSLFLRF